MGHLLESRVDYSPSLVNLHCRWSLTHSQPPRHVACSPSEAVETHRLGSRKRSRSCCFYWPPCRVLRGAGKAFQGFCPDLEPIADVEGSRCLVGSLVPRGRAKGLQPSHVLSPSCVGSLDPGLSQRKRYG